VLEFTGGAVASPQPDWGSRSAEEANPKTLSLSACRRIVEEHGGRILSRRSPDGHLDFRLELPAVVKGERSGNPAGITAAASTNS
jgi:hypothetical protein